MKGKRIIAEAKFNFGAVEAVQYHLEWINLCKLSWENVTSVSLQLEQKKSATTPWKLQRLQWNVKSVLLFLGENAFSM